jgi:small subunit ribosomal protein S18
MPRNRRDRDRKDRKDRKAPPIRRGKKRHCQFCAEKTTYIDYKDIALLRRFMSERGKIRARRVTGNCAQHQRLVATAVKNARQMALLPYSNR